MISWNMIFDEVALRSSLAKVSLRRKLKVLAVLKTCGLYGRIGPVSALSFGQKEAGDNSIYLGLRPRSHPVRWANGGPKISNYAEIMNFLDELAGKGAYDYHDYPLAYNWCWIILTVQVIVALLIIGGWWSGCGFGQIACQSTNW